MDTQRLILFIALAFVLLLLWQAWEQDYGPAPSAPVTQDSPATQEVPATSAPVADIPQGAPAEQPPTTTAEGSIPTVQEHVLQTAERIRVETDALKVEIDTHGGDLRRLYLKAYPVSLDAPEQPFELLNDTLPKLFVAQSGLIGAKSQAPNHHAVYTAEERDYRLTEGSDQLAVRLTWNGPNGLIVVKTYTFHRGSYLIEVNHEVQNATGETWKGRQYRQLQRTQVAEEGQSSFIYTYMGGVLYSEQDKYQKIDFADMVDADLDVDTKNGWAAMLQHYFLAAWVPPADELDKYYTKALPGARYLIGLVSPQITVEPGQTGVFTSRLYAGPKLQDVLAKIAPGLELSVDYGILTVLAQPLFWLLKTIHRFIGNWGWAIILVTLLIKLAFFKLSEASYKSMANMRRMQPRLQTLKERYSDDKQKLSQAMMELYKKEKINPLGGCLPIVIQIPVFIALYWVLLESVELRQAPFILWIKDLATPDPYFVLPVIMGVTMVIQQKLNPAPMDPIQQKVMMILPLVFTVFFAFFPSGLVLYWVANNALSITQQWVITRKVEAAASKKT